MSYLKAHDEHTQKDGFWSASIVTVDSALGAIGIAFCENCPILFVDCEHKRNSWNVEGMILTCDLCGADGT